MHMSLVIITIIVCESGAYRRGAMKFHEFCGIHESISWIYQKVQDSQ